MNIIGIITAEYNPFHNGHAYQIACAKKQFGADAVVVVIVEILPREVFRCFS